MHLHPLHRDGKGPGLRELCQQCGEIGQHASRRDFRRNLTSRKGTHEMGRHKVTWLTQSTSFSGYHAVLAAVIKERSSMGGPIVRTGTTPEFWSNWDRVFGGKKGAAPAAAKKAAGKKAAGKKAASTGKKAAPKKAAKKKS
jgi:hypothetical protein